MDWKLVFQKGMFWIFLLTFLSVNILSSDEVEGINKSVGWGADRSNLLFYFALLLNGLILIYMIGYGVLAVLKKRTNLYFSIFHLILCVLLYVGVEKSNLFTLLIGLLSFVVFVLNIVKANRVNR